MIITQIREYASTYTESKLFINGGERFCWVLEDKKQPVGVKIPGETCVPEGTYNVAITKSQRWKKNMLILYNSADFVIERDNVQFTGIRPHGGNDVSDTDGCPLCAYQTNHNGRVWSRASDDIFAKVEVAIGNGEEIYWIMSSL